MTREEAIEKAQYESFEIREFVNKIYDDFESKTCESCKYALAEDGDVEGDIYRCEYLYDDIDNTGYFPNDFGCNKFEPKWEAK